jgi:DNA-binding NarL/FixJ family response regulator
LKILILDNPKVGWKRVSNLLDGMHNIELTGSNTGTTETINDIEVLKPDVLIVDIDMPVRKGIELLHQINRDYAFLAVIVLTNASSSVLRKQCTEAGARFFFDKATEFDKVPRAIEILQKDYQHASN